ncbi:ABC transporter permease [Deinococcus detaillensis]|uniref:ABC transporter permease n=1 Tax=Deinococcus detaillensis TaxID=2592048 RepID=A0A553UP55_9DEIO|nr:ABC transporter permease [Deinococcus detaillensis]TSA81741.1 ABC transporter permease [Deinococcus detaillensis]
MTLYILRRIVQVIPTFFGATLLAFVIIQLTPGNFTDRFALDPNADAQQLERLRENFGLNQPVAIQFFKWIWGIISHGYLGESFTYRAPVTTIILPLIVNSFSLALISLVLTYLLAIPIGIYQAVRQHSFGDQALSFLSVAGLAIPNFFFILLLIVVVLFFQSDLRQVAAGDAWYKPLLSFFTYDLKNGLALPVGGMRTSEIYDGLAWWQQIGDRLWHLVLPTIVITTGGLSSLVRVVRGQVLDFLQADFIRTARAKGLVERTVIYKHLLRNAISPVISGIGTVLPELVTGAGLVEFVYRWPGITPGFVAAIQQKDLYVVMGLLVLSAIFLMIGNLISDVLLALIDPRIRYS